MNIKWLLILGLMTLGACRPAAFAVETRVLPGAELYIRILKTTQTQAKGELQLWKRGAGGQYDLDLSLIHI